MSFTGPEPGPTAARAGGAALAASRSGAARRDAVVESFAAPIDADLGRVKSDVVARLAQLDGTLTADEARERTVVTTRRFVRRQRSWFRRDPGIQWLPFDAPDLLEQARAVIKTPLNLR